jgi:hypothetical protein
MQAWARYQPGHGCFLHLTIRALEMGLERRCPDAGLLHHSDQGCTYGFTASMIVRVSK